MQWERVQSLGEINLVLLPNGSDKAEWMLLSRRFFSVHCSRVSPQRQPLLHLPEKPCVEPVQRLKGGEDGVLQGLWGGLVFSHRVLEGLKAEKNTTCSDVVCFVIIFTKTYFTMFFCSIK